MTRRGIEYNLEISPYSFKNESGYIFVFSSKYHLNTFIKKQAANRKKINDSLSNRFNFYIEFNTLADFILYRQIEQRGFLILKGGDVLKCQNIIKLGGEKATQKNLHD